MTHRDISSYRLHNQQLEATTCTDAVQVVSWLGAMQAQEYALSQWSIGMRAASLTAVEVEAAFTQGRILRTHLLRPTWHLVTREDIGWLLQLTAPQVEAKNAYMYRKLELDQTLFKQSQKVLRKQLQGGNYLTRSQLNTALQQKGIQAQGLRLSYIMMQAELAGVICSGPRKGNQFTYALLEERVPTGSALSAEEALAELTQRYFISRGPATLPDLATWSGLPLTQVRKGMHLVKAHFTEEKIGSHTYYFPSSSPAAEQASKGGAGVCLLPLYDEFIMAYKNREAILQLLARQQPAPKLAFDSTILVEGQVAGSWKRVVNKNSIELSFAFLIPPTQAQYALFLQVVNRFSAFTGLPVKLLEST